MKATRTVTWTLKDGRKAEAEIEVEKVVSDKTYDADGDKINLGGETIEFVKIILTVDGKVSHIARSKPRELNPKFDAKMIEKGAYVRVGDAYLPKESGEIVINGYNEAATEAETAEYTELKKIEDAKKEREWEAVKNYKPEQHGPGWCNKCQSYCYGDCKAN